MPVRYWTSVWLRALSPSRVWFCSLDVSAKSRVVVTGDNMGHVILLSTDGKEVGTMWPTPTPNPPLVLCLYLIETFLCSFGISECTKRK